jgi:HEAT repeat protein
LFVVPAVIVAGVVLLWLAFNWIARPRVADPEQIVHSLRSSNQARFQRAKALVDMLRMPQRYQLNDNQQLCHALAAMLSEMVDAGVEAESEVPMRFILAGALGEFSIDDGLDALIKAAQKDPERDIRRKAVNAIAVLGQTFVQRDPPEALFHPDLVPMLSAMANQPEDELLRSEAAFTIGALVQAPDVDSRLIDELALLAEDFYPDARYNAAMGLARIGDLRAVETVSEMLDLDVIEASVRGERKFSDQVSDESLARQRAEKRTLILRNAVIAADSLAQQRPADQLQSIESALRRFVSAAAEYQDPWPIPGSIVESARSVLLRFHDGD